MLKHAIIALCFVALASAGVVSPIDRCGGVGTPVQLRVSGCTTPPCIFISGTEYEIEGDFIPFHSSTGVSLKLTLVIGGIQVVVLDAPVEGQPIVAGDPYTIAYALTPNDILAGQRVTIELEVRHTATNVVEICVSAPGIIE